MEDQTINQRLNAYETILNEYLNKTGVSRIKYSADVDNYLSLTQEQIRAMDEEELGEAAILLSQYALYLQKEENHHRTRTKWAEHVLNAIVNRQLSNFGGQYTTTAEKKAKIIQADSAAQTVNKIFVYAEGYASEIAFLAKGVHNLVDCIKDQKWTKRNQK